MSAGPRTSLWYMACATTAWGGRWWRCCVVGEERRLRADQQRLQLLRILEVSFAITFDSDTAGSVAFCHALFRNKLTTIQSSVSTGTRCEGWKENYFYCSVLAFRFFAILNIWNFPKISFLAITCQPLTLDGQSSALKLRIFAQFKSKNK